MPLFVILRSHFRQIFFTAHRRSRGWVLEGVIGVGICVALCSCATIPSPAERRELAAQLAGARGWQGRVLTTDRLPLFSYAPDRQAAGEQLTVYIEGDGFAWLTRSQPSADPTPREPVALRLALAQPAGKIAYLARPCQYVDAERSGCSARYWTEARFAPEVIAATDQAVTQLKATTGAERLVLVGYSGGAAVAALLAARRDDVVRLVTVAGNLDHRAWTRHHGVSPLNASLNPADSLVRLAGLPQQHFVGERDTVIPPALVADFVARLGPQAPASVRVVEGFDHQCCWAERWPALLADQ